MGQHWRQKSAMDRFVENVDASLWKSVHHLYAKALKIKAQKMKPDKKKDLFALDEWYQTELPKCIQGRQPNMHITHDELCKLMKWKLTRGKFRPRLTELVQTNSEEEVLTASTKAFKKLPNMSAAIQALTVLKAVGPATASAVLAAGSPEYGAFMADESMLCLPGLQPIKYDLNFYLTYMEKIKALVKQLNAQDSNKDWTSHKVELTLWTYRIGQTIDPSLFEELDRASKRTSNMDLTESKAKKQKT